MNQAKNPEYRSGRVDIAVEQCAVPSTKALIISEMDVALWIASLITMALDGIG